MQGKFKTLQEELAKKTITAEAAGGMVQATVNGRLELVKLRIDKSKIDVNDTEMLERRDRRGGRCRPGRGPRKT